jgi:hypothetical protein
MLVQRRRGYLPSLIQVTLQYQRRRLGVAMRPALGLAVAGTLHQALRHHRSKTLIPVLHRYGGLPAQPLGKNFDLFRLTAKAAVHGARHADDNTFYLPRPDNVGNSFYIEAFLLTFDDGKRASQDTVWIAYGQADPLVPDV